MRVVIHIGVHKTGTTYLQAALARNANWLLANSIYYRPTGFGQTSHYLTVKRFSGNSEDARLGKEELHSLIEDAQRSASKVLLISSEMLCEQRVDVDSFISVLSDFPTTVIAYMRRPDDLVISAYNQIVRDENHRRTNPLSDAHRAYDPSYKLILSRWMRPNLELVLAPYDRSQWVGGAITKDFLYMLGLDDYSNFDFSIDENESNASLPASLIEVLRRANHIKMSREEHNYFVHSLYELYREKPSAFPPYDILAPELRRKFVRELEAVIEIYRPYFRSGFDEKFLISEEKPSEYLRNTNGVAL